MVIKAAYNWCGYYWGKGSSKPQPPQDRLIDGRSVKVEVSCIFSKNTVASSQIDPEKHLSMKDWAVSMLIDVPDSMWPGIFKHHTILIIEGIEKTSEKDEFVRFWRKAHLTGPGTLGNGTGPQGCYSGHNNQGEVEIKEPKYGPFNLSRCKPNRRTWLFPSEKVKELIHQIEKEVKRSEGVFFRFLGENSFASETRYIVDFGRFHELKEQDSNKFKELYVLSRYFALYCQLRHRSNPEDNRAKQIISNFEKYLNLVGYNDSEIDPLVLLFLLLPVSMAEGVMPEEIIVPQVFRCMMRLGWSVINPRYVYSQFCKSREILNGIQKNKDSLIEFIYQTQQIKCVSQNCFNWVRNKLITLNKDITKEIGGKWWEKFALIPEWYLPTHLESNPSNSSENLTTVDQCEPIPNWWINILQHIHVSLGQREVAIFNVVTWDDLALKTIDPENKATFFDKLILKILFDALFSNSSYPTEK